MSALAEHVRITLENHFRVLREVITPDDPRREIVEAYFDNRDNITFIAQMVDGTVYVYNP